LRFVNGGRHELQGARAAAAIQADIGLGKLRVYGGSDRSSCRYLEGALKPLGGHLMLSPRNMPLSPWRVRAHQERDR
jgi:hypothetical protein